MHPRLFELPIFLIAAFAGTLLGLLFFGNSKRPAVVFGAAAAGGIAGGVFAFVRWGGGNMPIQSYGTMILIGFLFGVWMAARRSKRIGVDPAHCLDIGTYGAILGVIGARLLHMALNWPNYTPLFNESYGITGLDFFGAFVTSILFTCAYCKFYKIPVVPFLDLSVPSLIAGQSFGRIGCFLYGCCYGKPTALPWHVCFPPDSPPFNHHANLRLIPESAECSLHIHPTQLYASLAAALTAGFLYAYWPRRPYDGLIVSLMLIMAGTTRFFEELLRADEPPLFASIPWLTAAHYFALGAIATGTILLLYFRKHRELYKPVAP